MLLTPITDPPHASCRVLGDATSRRQLPKAADVLSVQWGTDDVNVSSFAAGSGRIGSTR